MKKYEELSLTFNKLIREYLTEAQMAQVIADNGTEAYDGACATHDHLDANMVMLDAYEQVIGEFDYEDEAHFNMWNDAWSMSRDQQFAV